MVPEKLAESTLGFYASALHFALQKRFRYGMLSAGFIHELSRTTLETGFHRQIQVGSKFGNNSGNPFRQSNIWKTGSP
jgi:hypothetical protein